jgi:fatty acid desaturase
MPSIGPPGSPAIASPSSSGRGLFGLLFLNNNLHATHHRAPGLAWYRLPAFHRRHRARLLADNGHLLYAGYGEVARRFLFRSHDDLIHPAHRSRRAQP